MELLYMYIKKFGNFIFDQKITFTNNFIVTLDDGILKVNKVNNPLSDFYKPNIKNISLMIGKNGTGKTTVLDIIGMNRSDRIDASYARKQGVLDEYFLLYYLYKDDANGEDIYGIEYLGDTIFKKVITNSEIGNYRNYNSSKISIGIQFAYDGSKFKDTGRHFFSEFNTRHSKLSDYLNIIHSNSRDRYSDRIKYDYRAIQQEDDDYLAKRIYFGNADEALKYKTIHDLKDDNSVGFINESAMIKLEDKIDYRISAIDAEQDKYKEVINVLENALPIYDRGSRLFSRSNPNIKSKRKITDDEKKKRYILDLLSRYLIDQFINGICTIIEDNVKRGFKRSITDDRPEKNSVLIDFSDKLQVEFVNSLGVNDSSFSMFGRPTDLEIETLNIYNIIEYFNPKGQIDDFNKCYKVLVSISRYLYSRIEAEYNYGDSNAYESAMEEFIEMLIKLMPDYFQSNNILIPLIRGKDGRNYSFDNDVYLMLEMLRKYNLNEKELHNGLNTRFKVSFNKLSEGENSLIDILSKVKYSVERARPGGLILLLLDEPDCALHPEWSRKFFDILVETLSNLKFNVQVVMTTHSPYMLSDFFPQNVFRFSRQGGRDGNLKIERLSEIKDKNGEKFSCFGANIFDLMRSSFFMSNSIGEFATKQINSVINEISNIDENFILESRDKIEFLINNIGEPALKNSIERMYDKKLESVRTIGFGENYEDLLNFISNPKEKEQVREFLEGIKKRTME